MRNLLMVILLSILTSNLLASTQGILLSAKLGQSTNFSLQLTVDHADGHVWGETIYHRKDGKESHIKVYGYCTELSDSYGKDSITYYLYEYIDNNKECGSFVFSLKDNLLCDGGFWQHDGKKLFINSGQISSINKGNNVGRSDYEYMSNLNLGIRRIWKTNVDISLNDVPELTIVSSVSEPMFCLPACKSSILSWVSSLVDYNCSSFRVLSKVLTCKVADLSSLVSVKENEYNGGCLSYSVDCRFETPQIMTYSFMYCPFWGGVSPCDIHIQSFSKESGKALNWNDFFVDPNSVKLKTIVENALFSQNQDVDIELERGANFELPTANPVFENGNIVFYYLNYEAASYEAARIVSCEVPLSELKLLLTPYFRSLVLEDVLIQ